MDSDCEFSIATQYDSATSSETKDVVWQEDDAAETDEAASNDTDENPDLFQRYLDEHDGENLPPDDEIFDSIDSQLENETLDRSLNTSSPTGFFYDVSETAWRTDLLFLQSAQQEEIARLHQHEKLSNVLLILITTLMEYLQFGERANRRLRSMINFFIRDGWIPQLADIIGSFILTEVSTALEYYLNGTMDFQSVHEDLTRHEAVCPQIWPLQQWIIYNWLLSVCYVRTMAGKPVDVRPSVYSGYTAKPQHRISFHHAMTPACSKFLYTRARHYRQRHFIRFADLDPLNKMIFSGQLRTLLPALLLELSETIGFLIWGGQATGSPLKHEDLDALFEACKVVPRSDEHLPPRQLNQNLPFGEPHHITEVIRAFVRLRARDSNQWIDDELCPTFRQAFEECLPGPGGRKYLELLNITGGNPPPRSSYHCMPPDLVFHTEDGRYRCFNLLEGSQCETSFSDKRSFVKHRLLRCPMRPRKYVCGKTWVGAAPCLDIFPSQAALRWHQEEFCPWRNLPDLVRGSISNIQQSMGRLGPLGHGNMVTDNANVRNNSSLALSGLPDPPRQTSHIPQSERICYVVGPKDLVARFCETMNGAGWGPEPTDSNGLLCGHFALSQGIAAIEGASDKEELFRKLQAVSPLGSCHFAATELQEHLTHLRPGWKLALALRQLGQPPVYEVLQVFAATVTASEVADPGQTPNVIFIHSDNAKQQRPQALNHFSSFGPNSTRCRYEAGEPPGWIRDPIDQLGEEHKAHALNRTKGTQGYLV